MTGIQPADVVTYNEDSSSPLTVFKPPAAAVGDLLVVAIVQDGGLVTDLTTPSGWLDEGSSVNISGQRAKVFSHIVAGGDPSTWDFPYNVGSSMAAMLTRWTEAEGTPTIAVTSNNTASNGSSFDSPDGTPSGGGDADLAILTNPGAAQPFSYTAPVGMVDLGYTQAVGGQYQAIAAAWKTTTDGSPTGVQTWTGISPTALPSGSFTILIKWSGVFDPDPPRGIHQPPIPPWLLQALVASKATPVVGNSGEPVIQQQRTGGASGTNITLVTDPATQVGDLLVAVHGNNFYTAAQMLTPTGTAGTWTQQALGDQGSNTVHMKVWTRFVTVAGAQTVTLAPAIDEEHTVTLFVISGADPTTPVDKAAGGNGAASTSHIAPALTPDSNNDLLLCGAQSAGQSIYTPPPGMNEMSEVNVVSFITSTTARQTMGILAGTSVGTRTFTSSISAAYASVSVAIRPVQPVVAAPVITPASVDALASIPTPTVTTGSDVTVTPATVAAACAVGAPTVQAGSSVSPATVAAAAGVGSPTVTAGIGAATVAAVAAIGSPTVAAGSSVSPATVAAVGGIGAPTVRAGSSVSPATVAAVGAVGAPTVQAGSSVSPATVAAVAAIATPTVTTSGNATATPATVAAVAAIGSPTVQAGSSVSPATVAAIGAVGAPTVQAGSSVSAATVAAVGGVGAPTLHAGAVVSPATVAAVAAIATPTVTAAGNATATPATVAAIGNIGTASVSTGSRVNPSTVAATAAVATPTVSASAAVTVATVAGVASIGAPTLATGSTATPATVAAAASIGAPTVLAAAPTPGTLTSTTAGPRLTITSAAGQASTASAGSRHTPTSASARLTATTAGGDT